MLPHRCRLFLSLEAADCQRKIQYCNLMKNLSVLVIAFLIVIYVAHPLFKNQDVQFDNPETFLILQNTPWKPLNTESLVDGVPVMKEVNQVERVGEANARCVSTVMFNGGEKTYFIYLKEVNIIEGVPIATFSAGCSYPSKVVTYYNVKLGDSVTIFQPLLSKGGKGFIIKFETYNPTDGTATLSFP